MTKIIVKNKKCKRRSEKKLWVQNHVVAHLGMNKFGTFRKKRTCRLGISNFCFGPWFGGVTLLRRTRVISLGSIIFSQNVEFLLDALKEFNWTKPCLNLGVPTSLLPKSRGFLSFIENSRETLNYCILTDWQHNLTITYHLMMDLEQITHHRNFFSDWELLSKTWSPY